MARPSVHHEVAEHRPVDPRHLAGVAEIAALFLVSRTVVSNWDARRDRNGFPLPVCRLASGPVYDVNEVLSWYAGYVPLKGGRPGRAPGAGQLDTLLGEAG